MLLVEKVLILELHHGHDLFFTKNEWSALFPIVSV
jgi:hypothetical protein